MSDVLPPPVSVPEPAENAPLRWYQGIPRTAWIVLIVSALGWMFDTFDQHLFNLERNLSIREILETSQHLTDTVLSDTAKAVGGQVTAVFLLGWAVGGFVFGVLGDRIGRTRTMTITILIYAVFTGLNGLVQTIPQYMLCRFMIALGVGGEFAAGAALVAESFPQRSRAMALGTLQSLSAVGNMAAAVVTLVLSSWSWRWVFAIGALPALLTVFIRRNVKEPDSWHNAQTQSADDPARKEVGSISSLFTNPTLRRNTIAGVLMATAGVAGVWGVGFFSPELVGSALSPMIAERVGASKGAEFNSALQHWRSLFFLIQMIGGFCGMFAYAPLSERIGRRRAAALCFVLGFLAVQATFWGLRDVTSAFLLAFPLGFGTLAPFAAYSVYFPELYPTRVRTTGVGFCYNFARIVAAAAPFTLGTLTVAFKSPTDATYGLRVAASLVASIYALGLLGLLFAPETRGKPLPE